VRLKARPDTTNGIGPNGTSVALQRSGTTAAHWPVESIASHSDFLAFTCRRARTPVAPSRFTD